MCDTIKILPAEPGVGAPITAWVHADHGSPAGVSLRVTPLGIAGLEPFEVALSNREGRREAQFSVSFPGRYELLLGTFKRVISVAPRQELGFAMEFGISALAVTICVGGILLWLKRRKIRSAAGSV